MGKDGFLAKKNGLSGLWQQKKTQDNHFLKKTTPGHLFVLFKDFSDSVLIRSPLSGEYQDQVPTPIPEIKPMRALWISLALCLVPGLSRADVVYSVTSAGTGGSLSSQVFSSNSGAATGSGTYGNTIGQSFQNIGQSAFVDSVNFRLRRSTATAFTTGTLKVGIYAVTGSAQSYAPDGGALISSTTIDASTITDTADNYAFSGFGTTSSLNASTNYMALLSWSGIDFGASSLEVGLFSYPSHPLPSPYQNYNLASGGSANSTQQMYGTINVSAVPEPGTLLLGGIAAACGGGGAWWGRRRLNAKQPAATETAG